MNRNQITESEYGDEIYQQYYNFTRAVREHQIDLPENFDIIKEILSEAHDEGEYYWLIASNAGFQVITGSHDYTGWECQSDAHISPVFQANEIHLHVPEYDNQMRPVRQMMIDALLLLKVKND